jgi:uncharacterized Zn-binding protein involved in type VI secretion
VFPDEVTGEPRADIIMAKRRFILLGDKTSHGGTVITASSNMTMDGIPVARIGDLVSCPRCNGNPHQIVGGAGNVTLDGKNLAREGDKVSDGSTLIATQQYRGTHSDGSGGSKKVAAAAGVMEQGSQFEHLTTSLSATPAPSSQPQPGPKPNEIEYNIKLKSGGNRLITPLAIPDYEELPSGTTKNQQTIDFTVESRKSDADSLTIEIFDGDKLIFSDGKTTALIPKGEHDWQWDGYDSNGILDTMVLKSKNLKAKLTAKSGSETNIKELKLSGKADEVDWVDVKIDRVNYTANITVRVSYSDGGIDGSNPHKLTALTFDQLKAMAVAGIELYWSRNGSRQNNIGAPITTAKGTYKVTVTADPSSSPKARNFPIIEKLDDSFGRATSIKGFQKIYHNAGFWFHWNSDTPSGLADAHFKHTAAHEFGHLILNEYGDGGIPEYSWTHKGSSTLFQNTIPNTPYPRTGEVDVMKYFSDGPWNEIDYNDYYDRSVIAEEDVKGMIWLTRVKF